MNPGSTDHHELVIEDKAVLARDEVQQFQSIANSRSWPHSIVQRAPIVLACGAGETNAAIAMRMGLTGMTVGKWRKRYRGLNLPDKAVVLCIDEATQIQALDCTQPLLPMGLGYVEGVTHDYIRYSTTTLFAALDVATGAVIAECKSRHRHQEFLRFLRRIDKEVPPELNVHLIVDNDCTHKHAVERSSSAQR